MAADPAELAALTRKLRGKGLSDAQVTESLRGLGFTKAQAEGAVGDNKPPTPKPAAAPPTRPAGGNPASAAGGSLPTLTAPDLSQLSLKPPKRLKAGDVGGFAAGLVLYTLALNFLRYGKPGVRGWIGAKFLNRPAGLADTGTTTQQQQQQSRALLSTKAQV